MLKPAEHQTHPKEDPKKINSDHDHSPEHPPLALEIAKDIGIISLAIYEYNRTHNFNYKHAAALHNAIVESVYHNTNPESQPMLDFTIDLIAHTSLIYTMPAHLKAVVIISNYATRIDDAFLSHRRNYLRMMRQQCSSEEYHKFVATEMFVADFILGSLRIPSETVHDAIHHLKAGVKRAIHTLSSSCADPHEPVDNVLSNTAQLYVDQAMANSCPYDSPLEALDHAVLANAVHSAYNFVEKVLIVPTVQRISTRVNRLREDLRLLRHEPISIVLDDESIFFPPKLSPQKPVTIKLKPKQSQPTMVPSIRANPDPNLIFNGGLQWTNGQPQANLEAGSGLLKGAERRVNKFYENVFGSGKKQRHLNHHRTRIEGRIDLVMDANSNRTYIGCEMTQISIESDPQRLATRVSAAQEHISAALSDLQTTIAKVFFETTDKDLRAAFGSVENGRVEWGKLKSNISALQADLSGLQQFLTFDVDSFTSQFQSTLYQLQNLQGLSTQSQYPLAKSRFTNFFKFDQQRLSEALGMLYAKGVLHAQLFANTGDLNSTVRVLNTLLANRNITQVDPSLINTTCSLSLNVLGIDMQSNHPQVTEQARDELIRHIEINNGLDSPDILRGLCLVVGEERYFQQYLKQFPEDVDVLAASGLAEYNDIMKQRDHSSRRLREIFAALQKSSPDHPYLSYFSNYLIYEDWCQYSNRYCGVTTLVDLTIQGIFLLSRNNPEIIDSMQRILPIWHFVNFIGGSTIDLGQLRTAYPVLNHSDFIYQSGTLVLLTTSRLLGLYASTLRQNHPKRSTVMASYHTLSLVGNVRRNVKLLRTLSTVDKLCRFKNICEASFSVIPILGATSELIDYLEEQNFSIGERMAIGEFIAEHFAKTTRSRIALRCTSDMCVDPFFSIGVSQFFLVGLAAPLLPALANPYVMTASALVAAGCIIVSAIRQRNKREALTWQEQVLPLLTVNKPDVEKIKKTISTMPCYSMSSHLYKAKVYSTLKQNHEALGSLTMFFELLLDDSVISYYQYDSKEGGYYYAECIEAINILDSITEHELDKTKSSGATNKNLADNIRHLLDKSLDYINRYIKHGLKQIILDYMMSMPNWLNTYGRLLTFYLGKCLHSVAMSMIKKIEEQRARIVSYESAFEEQLQCEPTLKLIANALSLTPTSDEAPIDTTYQYTANDILLCVQARLALGKISYPSSHTVFFGPFDRKNLIKPAFGSQFGPKKVQCVIHLHQPTDDLDNIKLEEAYNLFKSMHHSTQLHSLIPYLTSNKHWVMLKIVFGHFTELFMTKMVCNIILHEPFYQFSISNDSFLALKTTIEKCIQKFDSTLTITRYRRKNYPHHKTPLLCGDTASTGVAVVESLIKQITDKKLPYGTINTPRLRQKHFAELSSASRQLDAKAVKESKKAMMVKKRDQFHYHRFTHSFFQLRCAGDHRRRSTATSAPNDNLQFVAGLYQSIKSTREFLTDINSSVMTKQSMDHQHDEKDGQPSFQTTL